jgi:hypothetical protein
MIEETAIEGDLISVGEIGSLFALKFVGLFDLCACFERKL